MFVRAGHRGRLRGLAEIDGMVDFKLGEDVICAARSYDMGLLTPFHDQRAYEGYCNHPRQ